MKSKPNLNQLQHLVSNTLGIEIDQLQNNADFIDDLNAGPLELKDLFHQIEIKFAIKLEDPSAISTFTDLVKQFQQGVDETYD